mgnify:CR=1 FL=1|tara:strand:- start:5348 stop:6016 length:669 start_codon:yes stop_codon:yes gene_type:complete
MLITGTVIGILEIFYFILISYNIKIYFNIGNIDTISYYWLMITILTGFWEYIYITNYDKVIKIANNFLENNTHVWTNKYNISYILPWKLSKIFYAEYGAYADREYIINKYNDKWSKIIEGTHALLCGMFSLFAIINFIFYNFIEFYICCSIAMGCQLMNSILYMNQYKIQTYLKNNLNYDDKYFPCGKYLSKRPFMYVNILWTIMPVYIIYKLLINNLIIFN